MEPSRDLILPSRRAVLSGSAAGLLAPQVALGQTPPTPAPARLAAALSQLDKLATDALRQTGVPGMAIAVVHRDRVVYLKGFGVRQAGKPAAVDADTVFQLASLSKPIAATVVAGLVGDGLVAWDDPIVRHDPGFEMRDPWVTRQVTLRDMFAHRSGLPGHAGDRLEDLGFDRGEILYRLRYQKPGGGFRAHYAYTNFGLTAAAVAAARAAGKAWEDLSAERLYRPAGMTETSSHYADFVAAANRAHGHVRIDGKWIAKYSRDPDAQSPAGGVSASVRDMARWVRLQLGRGTLDGMQIVKPAGLDETHRPQIVSNPPKDPAVDRAGFYGLGWGVGYDGAGRVEWSHSGAFNLGAATRVHLVPGEELGIVALTNAQPVGLPEAVCRSFLDLALDGRIGKDWLAFFGRAFAAAMAPDYGTAVDYAKPPVPPVPALASAGYIGRYHNDLYGPIAVAAAGPGLVLKLGPKSRAYPMRHFERDVFTYQPSGENAFGPSAVTFTIGADGKASAVTIENLDLNGQGRFARVAAD